MMRACHLAWCRADHFRRHAMSPAAAAVADDRAIASAERRLHWRRARHGMRRAAAGDRPPPPARAVADTEMIPPPLRAGGVDYISRRARRFARLLRCRRRSKSAAGRCAMTSSFSRSDDADGRQHGRRRGQASSSRRQAPRADERATARRLEHNAAMNSSVTPMPSRRWVSPLGARGAALI